jgi:ABC-type sugar transport system ATPase subunit
MDSKNIPLLKMVEISKAFYGTQALDKANLVVDKGEVHGLVGENGAGKSTLIKILAGAEIKDSGQIFFKGEEVDFKNPLSALRVGIAVIYQELSLAPNMRVCENIFLGHEPTSDRWKMKFDLSKMKKLAKARLEEIGTDINPMSFVFSLNTSEQQIIEIARALETNADIIVMDEPTSALSSKEVEKLFNIIRELKAAGKTIIYISHRLEELIEISDNITVLRDGRTIDTVKTEEATIPKIARMMVGDSLKEEKKKTVKTIFSDKILEVKNLSRHLPVGQNFQDISFSLHSGEILGITGLMGAGKTELARILFGIDPFKNGQIFLNNKPIKPKSSTDALKLGIGLVPEDRQRQGLLTNRPLIENLSICSLDLLSNLGVLVKKKAYKKCNNIISQLDIKTSGIGQIVSGLSGGNQQKVVVGKWLIKNMQIIIFDEPTRGIDVGAKPKIHNIIRRLADEGVGIILISFEIPEICRICDSVLVLYKGEVTGKFFHPNVKEKDVFSSVLGNKV